MKKLRLAFYLLAAALIVVPANSSAQGRFGKDSADCVNNLNFYQDYLRQGNMDEAYVNWTKAMKFCPPKVSQNMYINGTQVTTADEIRSNGITAWCGVNNDSEGEAKDGVESFGIWTSGVPQFELSQTIEGLENGTYLVTAGLMAGANGGGSRLTTQRIFGNLNSAYYADESMYDQSQLDNSEVYYVLHSSARIRLRRNTDLRCAHRRQYRSNFPHQRKRCRR